MKRVELKNHDKTSIYYKLHTHSIDVFLLNDQTRLMQKGEITLKLKSTTPYIVVKNTIEEIFKIKL
jgi:hypothetical protein